MKPEAPHYQNRSQALAKLQGMGFSLEKSKFYRDCAAGLCKMEPDKSISERALLNYTKHPKAGLKKAGEIDGPNSKLAERKQRLEIRRLEAEVKRREIETGILQGRYCLISQRDRDMAGLAMVLETHLRNMCHMEATDWAEAAASDPARAAESLERAVWTSIETQFHAISRTKQFNVEFAE